MAVKLSALLGDLEVSVRTMASDEGMLFENSDEGLRVHKHLRAGNVGNNMCGQGSSGTDRHNHYLPRRQ